MTRTRSHRLGAILGAFALTFSMIVVSAGPSQAASTPSISADSGSLAWGFRESFRNYVGQQIASLPPIGKLPEGERIVVKDGATFDLAGRPTNPAATSSPNETLPYLFPVSGGTYTDSSNLTVDTKGGVNYRFPSHAFDAAISNISVVIKQGVATLVGDLGVTIVPNDLGYPDGEFGGQNVTIATIGSIQVAESGGMLSITGSDLKATAAAADALQSFVSEGNPLDSFTMTAALSGDANAPRVTPSQSRLPADTVSEITVNGTGFDPNMATGTRPPLAGKAAGVYVTFGFFGNDWRPSAGAIADNRPGASTLWAVLAEDVALVGGPARGGIVLEPDGSFTGKLTIDRAMADAAAAEKGVTAGAYGIYTYAGAGASAADYETFTPIVFTSSDGQDILVTIPGETDPEPEPGELTMIVDNAGGAVDLGIATAQSDRFVSTGSINPVTVRDTRIGAPAWSVSGSSSAFASTDGSFSGKYLGWTPKIVAPGAGAVPGAGVSAGFSSGNGLTQSSTLASGSAGHESGQATMGADLSLEVPITTIPGSYSAVLTLTVLG